MNLELKLLQFLKLLRYLLLRIFQGDEKESMKSLIINKNIDGKDEEEYS